MKNYWLNVLNLYEIDDGENHWYAATSCEDAIQQHLELFDMDLDAKEHMEVKMVDDDLVLPVCEDYGDYTSKTAKTWCRQGRGLIASSVY